MSQGRDPAIKLFGRNIPLTDSRTPTVSEQDSDLEPQASSNHLAMVLNGCEEGIETGVESVAEQSCEQGIHSELDNQKDIDHQNSMQKNAKVVQDLEEDQVDKSDTGGQEKVLKKPNKVLPCPRCKSLETKFCYFNNYNVNQPRHFCKNCQRYWTAGGTIRNVPVGAGRRKNKHSGAQCHQVVVPSNVTPVTRADTLNSTSNQRLSCVGLPASSRLVQGIGEVQNFRKDAALCESMATVLNLEEEKRSVEIGPSASEDISDEPLSPGSSLAATTSQESEFREKEIEQVGLPRHCNSSNTTQTLHCYPASQCAYHFNPGWNTMVFGSSSGISNTALIGSPPMVPVPGFCAPGITFPFLPGQYWGCMPSWDARKWNTLLVGSTGSPSAPSSTSNSSCSGNSLPTLGKHLRDANSQGEETKEQCLWVPKTLRIDDPEEAAKSSIWSTLGIKPGKDKPSIRGGIFKASQSKSDSGTNTSDADQVLKANPAAFSRCQSFQEST